MLAFHVLQIKENAAVILNQLIKTLNDIKEMAYFTTLKFITFINQGNTIY